MEKKTIRDLLRKYEDALAAIERMCDTFLDDGPLGESMSPKQYKAAVDLTVKSRAALQHAFKEV